jgi:hypothetical protein
MAKRKTPFDRDFIFKDYGNKLCFVGEQMTLKLQCSFKGSTWNYTIKFPKKVTDFAKCNDSETYYTLLEYYDDIAKLKVNENHFMRAYRDEKESMMIVTRVK